MSGSLGKKRKHRDGAPDVDTSSRELSGPQSQVNMEDKVRKKKRKIANLGAMYMGSSDTEEMPKRTQETEPASPIPKRKKTGDAFILEPTDQEHEDISTKKKKKRKEEPHQEADDITAGDASSSVGLNQKHNGKIKKSHKAKDSKRRHEDKGYIEEASSSKLTDLEGTSKKKKKRKEDSSLAKESLTDDNQHATGKKKKRKDGGGLQEEDNKSNMQHGVTEELLSHRKYPDGSETSEHVEETVKKKKKQKRKDEPNQEAYDIAVDDTFSEKIKKSSKSKVLKRDCGNDKGVPDKALDTESASIEDTASVKKKSKKDRREHLLDGSLAEESLTVDNQHATGKKKKRKGGGDLQEEDNERNMQHGFTEKLSSQTEYPDDSGTSEQVEESVKKKKKKREDLPEKALYKEHVNIEDRPSVKKKSKKDGREDVLEDSLVEESLTSENQHKSKKKKTKQKSGGDESQSQLGFTGEIVTKGKHQGGTDTSEKVDDGGDRAEDRLVEELLIPETQHAKKKKRKDGGGLQEDGFTEELFPQRKYPDGSETPKQVDKSVDQVENHVKKKKKKKTDDTAVDDMSSSVGLHGDEPSCSELAGTDRPSQEKKKKSKKDHREHPPEDSLVEEPLNPDAQHTSQKKSKRKDGGDEIHRQRVKYPGGSVEQSVDQAEVRVKKLKKKKHSDRREETSENLTEETQLEDVDPSANSTERNPSSQSRVVESDGNMEGRAEEDTEQTLTSGSSKPQTSAFTDTVQDGATQDESEVAQNEGANTPATLDQNTEKRVRKPQKVPYVREKDVMLLKEYFPQMNDKKLLKLVTTHELERIRNAKQNGIMYRSGQFTFDEDELIKKNVQKFMSEVGIDSAEMLLLPEKFPDMKKTIEQLKKTFSFPQRIAEGLHRTSKDVIVRGRKLFDSASVRGRYSREEVQQLKKYQEIYGKKWQIIAGLMNRTDFSAKLKASQMRRDVNQGKWQAEETNRLIASVKEFVLDSLKKENNNSDNLVTVPKEKLYRGIPWVKIEEKVGTRNWTHCKTKWLNLVMMRMNDHINPLSGTLGILSSIKMITWLHDANVKDYGDVKWDKMSDFMGNIPNFLLQQHFFMLKQSIPDWKKMRLYEIMDILYNEKLPALEVKLSAAQEIPIEPEKKSEFLISEMFQECSDSDDKWESIVETGGGGGRNGGSSLFTID